jgi:tetratricopeptide (TPR) repeat protein
LKESILTFLAAAILTSGPSWAQSGYTAEHVQTLLTSADTGSTVRYALSRTQTEPSSGGAWGSLGIVYAVGLHRPEKAIPAFKYALAINPYSPQNYNALGEAYLAQRKFRVAAEAFEQASDLAPAKSIYWDNLAVAYTALGQTDRALSALKENERCSCRRLHRADPCLARARCPARRRG